MKPLGRILLGLYFSVLMLGVLPMCVIAPIYWIFTGESLFERYFIHTMKIEKNLINL